ncbi:MAG: glycosyltransferase family 4 protein [Pirellulaceae bacterium]
MTPLRIAMVTRRFWPLVGGAEMVMANLSQQFLEQGARPVILTAMWDSNWPTDLVHREVPVVRLPQPRTRGWGTWRYMRQLGRWLLGNRDQYDVVFVSMLKHSAYTAINVGQKVGVPVLLRAEGAGQTGDCQWQETARFGGRIRARCQQASGVVAASQQIADELVAAGYHADRVHSLSNGVMLGNARTETIREEARKTLAEVNASLQLEADAKLVVFTGRLDRNKGLLDLVDAWAEVEKGEPNSRLWLIGNGPDRDLIFERVHQRGLRDSILLPGSFDHVDVILQAADLFVLPSYAEGLSLSLLEAMAQHLPVVASDIAGNRQLVDDQVHGRLALAHDVPALARAILTGLAEQGASTEMAEAAFQRVSQSYSLEKMASGHMDLFRQALSDFNPHA